jgi:hypothetical protein
MRFLTILALAAVATPAGAAIQGDGGKTTNTRDVAEFDRIEVRDALDAKVKVGPARSVSVTIDGNLQPYVRLRVEDRKLVVDLAEDVRWKGEGRVDVTVPSLRAFSTRGSGDATIDGGSGDLGLSTAGSGELRWRGEADALAASTSGSADMVLAGKARSLDASTSGSGDIDARGLVVRDAAIRTSGSGDVEVTLAGGTLAASTSGSGDVTWYGEARVTAANTSGSGAVLHR